MKLYTTTATFLLFSLHHHHHRHHISIVFPPPPPPPPHFYCFPSTTTTTTTFLLFSLHHHHHHRHISIVFPPPPPQHVFPPLKPQAALSPSLEVKGQSGGSGENVWALVTYSHQTIFKQPSDYWLLIGHKETLCIILPNGPTGASIFFRVFVHDGYYLAILVRFFHRFFPTLPLPETEELLMIWEDVSDAISRTVPICSNLLQFALSQGIANDIYDGVIDKDRCKLEYVL